MMAGSTTTLNVHAWRWHSRHLSNISFIIARSFLERLGRSILLYRKNSWFCHLPTGKKWAKLVSGLPGKMSRRLLKGKPLTHSQEREIERKCTCFFLIYNAYTVAEIGHMA